MTGWLRTALDVAPGTPSVLNLKTWPTVASADSAESRATLTAVSVTRDHVTRRLAEMDISSSPTATNSTIGTKIGDRRRESSAGLVEDRLQSFMRTKERVLVFMALGVGVIVRTILNCALPIGDLRMLKSSRNLKCLPR